MLQELKGHLKITWDNEDPDLLAIISRGMAYLEDLTGTKLDFESGGPPRTLLLNYCRYDYNKAPEYFEDNFQKQIVRLQYQEAIKASKEVIQDEG